MDDKHVTTWPTTSKGLRGPSVRAEFDLILDLVPTIWVDDILEIDPAYLAERGLA